MEEPIRIVPAGADLPLAHLRSEQLSAWGISFSSLPRWIPQGHFVSIAAGWLHEGQQATRQAAARLKSSQLLRVQ
jgi:hypothetical protein